MVAEDIILIPLPVEHSGVEVSLLDLPRFRDEPSAAARFLAGKERNDYAGLRHPRRRREWLGARVCLKTILLQRGIVADPTDSEIVKDATGRPRLCRRSGAEETAVHDCSLSHKDRFACACVSRRKGIRVGVDVEKVSPRLLRLRGAFVNARDSWMRTHPPELRLTVTWALKEACSKAVGLGLGIGLGSVVCEETADGRYAVRVAEGLELKAQHVEYEGYVVAVCLWEHGAIDP